jgi:DNA-binding NarL/FixJ family response regulator
MTFPTDTRALIRVAVIEDHPLYREALLQVLADTGRIDVVAAAGSVEQFLADDPPEELVVVLDLHLPGRSGPNAIYHLTTLGHRVLVVSAGDERDEVMAALSAGARGYVPKSADAAEIGRAIESVAQGGNYVSPGLAAKLLSTGPAVEQAHLPALSEREREVLALLAAGERDHDIAEELGISVRTVRSHLDRIREKTGRRRRPDLTRYAIEEGILIPPAHAGTALRH